MNNEYNKQLKPLARSLRNSGTKAEACLWKYVLRAGYMKGYQFRRQTPILSYIADFMCSDFKLIIEVDGITHDFEENRLKDTERDAALNKLGYTVLRVSNQQVLNDINNVRRRIELWIEEREKEQGISDQTK